jgi:hypothetical protein
VTANLSLVDGTAFATNVSGSIPWAQFLNRKATWSDGTNTAVAFVKAVGTGETLDSDVLNGWNLTSGWGTNNANIIDANTFETTANNGYVNRNTTFEIGCLYKTTFNATPSLGTAFFRDTGTASTIINSPAAGVYKTAVAVTLWVVCSLSGSTVDINEMSTQKVTAPSATGCTFVNTRGGSTQNFLSVGINGNAASFTLTMSA